jgi:hypothetical protein
MRTAPAILSFATRTIAAAAAVASRPSGAPTAAMIAARRPSIETGWSTDSRRSGSRRPSARFASVIVGRVPPRP